MTRTIALALAILVSAAVARADEPIVLKFPFASVSPVYLRATKPWVDTVSAEGKGIFELQTMPNGSLSNAQNVYDRLVNNVFELAYGNHGPLTSIFPRTSVAELPFLVKESEIGSTALWNIFENGTIAAEYKDVKPLMLEIFPQSQFHLSRPVHTLEDMKGLKISAPNRVQGDIIEALGATPLSIPPPDVYQAANRKLINGIMTPWTGVIQFKVDEVTNFHLESWIGAATAFLLMNKNAWEKLPQAGKDVIERNSGRVLSKKFGHELDGIALDQRAEIKAKPGHTVVELDAKERERWAKRVAPVYDTWIARTPGGAKVLAAFRAEMAKLQPGDTK
jgi:TRAP-type C4-dicarboxylate transport system substrate-binding protein